ncbi:MAG: hypothetical protein LQ349_001144 [Xanthoria aureola]|nr:MAG: hypothetical protein LQ349_001144 [Xanthoria aureola]
MSDGEGERKALGVVPKFLAQIERCIARDEPVCMVLPAFPFKSVNKTTKVLGSLPDKGEEVALRHLDHMCQAIREVYKYGARVYIVSDGLVYNDLLGVSDQEVWKYGQALRQMAKDCMCHNIRFARLRDLLGAGEFPEPTSEEVYVEYAPQIRAEIVRRFLPRGFDPTEAIAKDPDMNHTYCGYARFMATELANTIHDMPSRLKRRHCKDVAKGMIVRGKAFAEAIAGAFPNHLRLSIHPSTETTKLSVSVVPQQGKCQMTPWHSALVRAVDGSVTMCHAQAVCTTTHELIFEHGRPSYFRERSDLFAWPGMDVVFEHLYPSGIRVTLRDQSSGESVHGAYVQKLVELGNACSPIVLCNFGNGLAADECGTEAKSRAVETGHIVDIKA